MNRFTRQERFRNIDLYPVVTGDFCAGRDSVEVLKQVAAGGAKVVQLREKDMPKREYFKLAEAYRKITLENDMLLIINDHLDIALAVEADGVHLGQDDFPLAPARKIAPGLILGRSTHSKDQALEAQAEGADYVNLGPIFATGTKTTSVPPLGTGVITETAPLLDIPFTIMGGIKEHHLAKLVSLGAPRIAMVTEITQADDIAAKVRKLRSYFT